MSAKAMTTAMKIGRNDMRSRILESEADADESVERAADQRYVIRRDRAARGLELVRQDVLPVVNVERGDASRELDAAKVPDAFGRGIEPVVRRQARGVLRAERRLVHCRPGRKPDALQRDRRCVGTPAGGDEHAAERPAGDDLRALDDGERVTTIKGRRELIRFERWEGVRRPGQPVRG